MKWQVRMSVVICGALTTFAGLAQEIPIVTEDPKSLEEIFAGEYVVAADFLNLCRSTEAARVEYCEGYIGRFTHNWKYKSSCTSSEATSSYCAGFSAAEGAARDRRESCPACSESELRHLLEECSPDGQRDGAFCAAYNEQIGAELDRLSNGIAKPIGRARGAYDASIDGVAHGWAGDESIYLESCVYSMTTPQEVVSAFYRFMEDNPAEQHSTAFSALARAQFYVLCLPD